jgi:thiol:disulfide interchange protein/DsbC/DsbD-like thiol-disulfide interchange protein
MRPLPSLTKQLQTLCVAALMGWGLLATVPAQAIDVLGSQVVQSEQVRAELLVHAPQGAAAGKTIWLGLKLRHSEGWHTYWKNPGDSGLPTQLEWQLPPGVVAGPMDWPTPKKFPLGPLANFGYDGTVLLPTPITLPDNWAGQALNVGLNASWLVCRTECIPEEGQFRTTVSATAPTTLNGLLFEDAQKRAPKEAANKSSQSSVSGQFLHFQSGDLPVAWHNKSLTFFPEVPNIIEPGAAWEQTWTNGRWTARLPLSDLRTEAPTTLKVVIAHNEGLAHGQSAQAGVRLSVPVSGSWPPTDVAATEGISPALAAALESNAATPGRTSPPGAETSLLLAVVGALLGGLILNLMPCVFPVLAIKVLAFAQVGDAQNPTTAAEVRRRHRAGGLAYTAGVVLSFVALGGLLVGLRAAGEQLGWGFQLQSPAVVATLATLFTLIGLNLAGLFEFGSVLPSSVASVQAKHPTVDSFLTGVLATAVASPCTAPFMGASLGLAVGLPTPQALAVFAAIGLGMAAPYLLASWMPSVARALPRPGAWMNTFKQFMAFPMFGTVVWLVWVLGQQSGMNGAAALLALLVMLAMQVWAWGLGGRGRGWLSALTALGLAGLLWVAGPLVVAQADDAPAPANGTAGASSGTWGAWSAEIAAEQTQAGRTVFVDYTAAWCVTCQFNKRTTLSHPDVLADFARRNVVLLRADWTRRDPSVTAALAAVGRNGVPTYALYRPGKPATVLSEVLSVDEVRQALAQP